MIARPGPLAVALLLSLVVAAALVPLVGGPYAVKLATRVMVLAIFVASLDLLVGVTGLVSFGHAMFFGIGAYAVYALSSSEGPADALLVIAAAVLAAAVAALVTGSVALVTRGFYFIMVTLAFGQMAFSLAFDTRIAGGSDGVTIDIAPVGSLGGVARVDLGDRVTLHYVCLVLLVVVCVGLLGLARSPFGRVLQGIRWNETRIAALGFDPYVNKLAAYVIAGAVAGLAGALFAAIDGFVSPELLGWRQSGLAIMMVVLGGVGTVYGPVLGALAFALTEEVLKTEAWVGPLASVWSLGLGVLLIAVVFGAPRGIAGLLEPRRRSPAPVPAELPPAAPRRRHATAAPSLEIEALSKAFGGLVAVDAVTLRFAPHRVHAVIGPNGAGKTTLIDLLSGLLRPTAGRILLDGADVGGLPAHAMARRGIGRSFQRTTVILPFTARENCLLAAQARGRGAAAEDEARRALAVAGLAARADTVAAALSHGEQRQLEIAMLIASDARLLLLDEPLGGMGPEETGRITALLRDLADDHTVILVEHDMDAVFAVADTLTVLAEGRLLAHGAPDEVRRDPAVRAAYLGRFADRAVPA